MLREYHKWESKHLNRDMELLTYGHGGARVIVFPTSTGRFYDWENRGMIHTLSRHIENGWVQLYCVDSVDTESWYNDHAHPKDRAARHLQFQDYIVNEVVPFTKSRNDNNYAIALGASFGAYHAVNVATRFPEHFQRAIGMSGLYDVGRWTYGYYDNAVKESNPCQYIASLPSNGKLDAVRGLDIILPIGKDDPSFDNNEYFSQLLWDRGIWHAFRIWDGNAHDWPCWQQMVLNYIGGPDTGG